jgi:hypothetical protein
MRLGLVLLARPFFIRYAYEISYTSFFIFYCVGITVCLNKFKFIKTNLCLILA